MSQTIEDAHRRRKKLATKAALYHFLRGRAKYSARDIQQWRDQVEIVNLVVHGQSEYLLPEEWTWVIEDAQYALKVMRGEIEHKPSWQREPQ